MASILIQIMVVIIAAAVSFPNFNIGLLAAVLIIGLLREAKLRYIAIAVLICCLIPMPHLIRDGGTILYDAILYDLFDHNGIIYDKEEMAEYQRKLAEQNGDTTGLTYPEEKRLKGIEIQVFGHEVYSNTYIE